MTDELTPTQLTSKQLADIADLYWLKRTERLAADKVAAALAAEENKAKATLIEQFLLQDITAIGGKAVRLAIKKDFVPAVKDWSKLYDYIKQNNAFELLEKRPGRLACKERWEHGEIIPGVEQFPSYSLSKEGVK
jgi:hypothetical protein